MPPGAKGVTESSWEKVCVALEMTLDLLLPNLETHTLHLPDRLQASDVRAEKGASTHFHPKDKRGKRFSRRAQYKEVGRKEFWQTTAIRGQVSRGKIFEQWMA